MRRAPARRPKASARALGTARSRRCHAAASKEQLGLTECMLMASLMLIASLIRHACSWLVGGGAARAQLRPPQLRLQRAALGAHDGALLIATLIRRAALGAHDGALLMGSLLIATLIRCSRSSSSATPRQATSAVASDRATRASAVASARARARPSTQAPSPPSSTSPPRVRRADTCQSRGIRDRRVRPPHVPRHPMARRAALAP